MNNDKEFSLDSIINKRKQLWYKHHDIQLDKEFVECACNEIVSNEKLRNELKKNPHKLIELAFTIVDKDKNTVPFFLNKVQKKLESIIIGGSGKGTKSPYFILKSRQQGATAYITALQTAFAITQMNFSGLTLADVSINATSIFNDKAKAMYDRLPECLKPTEKYNSKKEFFFSKLNSSWRVDAASKETARSRTLNFAHLSESAFYCVPFSFIESALFPALTKNAYVIIETTANGFNDMQTLWKKGTCINIFLEWWDSDEYETDDISSLSKLDDDWIRERVDWLKDKGIADNKIAWYVEKYNSLVDKDKIMQEFPCTPEEAFLSSGQCAFNKDKLNYRLDKIRDTKPVKKGRFEFKRYFNPDSSITIKEIKWIDDPYGEISIYQEPNPERRYVLGGDTAGEGSDFFVGQMIDNLTLNQVATYRVEQALDLEYATQMYCLGLMYNTALISIEVNFNIASVSYLESMDYKKIFVREQVDTMGTDYSNKYGFKTTKATKPLIISELRQIINDDVDIINDIATLQEMFTFEKKGDGMYGAIEGDGFHDDTVMALAIAYGTRHQQDIAAPKERKKKDLSHWMFETDDDEENSEWGNY